MPQDQKNPQSPEQQQLTPQQIQMAMAQGVKLIEACEMVPKEIAMSGTLPVISGIVAAIANGQILLCSPEQMKIIEAAGGGQQGPSPKLVETEDILENADQGDDS